MAVQNTRPNTALIVIDMQEGFNNEEYWGPTANHPQCEQNVAQLLAAWRERDFGPLIVVRHQSVEPGSPLAASSPGFAFMRFVASQTPDLLVTKQVNSAFLGDVDLRGWLREHDVNHIVLCGIQTNMCVETTARMGGNLGYAVTVALDATRTFDLADVEYGNGQHGSMTAVELMRATAINLQGGDFAQVSSTAQVLAELA